MSQDGSIQDNGFLYSGAVATRMACHLGDHKASVLCNILGDQPLFYIDYVDAEDAELTDQLLAADMPADYYPENVEALRTRLSRLESASQHIDGYARDNIETAFDAAVNGLARFTTPEEILACLEKSRFAMAMFDAVRARNLHLIMNPQVDTAQYDRGHVTIHINPRLPAPIAALMCVRALRQAWLHIQGAAINPLHFAPEEAILLNRIQHADMACAMVRAAWEMNLSGQKDAWGRILTGSAYDLAAGFAREAITDFRALNNGHAAHATFERWFFSGRCKDVDRKLIQQMLADHHGFVFDNAHVSRMVTADIIARTGDLPLGRNYLTGMVEIVLSDPLFTEVRDRSNANFLWFIKFERSFRATEGGPDKSLEHSLQGMNAIPAGVIHSTLAEQQEASNAGSAEIITFKGSFNGRKPAAQGAMGAKNGTDDMATVYYLDHFLSLSNR